MFLIYFNIFYTFILLNVIYVIKYTCDESYRYYHCNTSRNSSEKRARPQKRISRIYPWRETASRPYSTVMSVIGGIQSVKNIT